MKKALLYVSFLMIALVAFNACKKDNNNDEIIATAEDLAMSEDFAEQNDADIDQGIEDRGGSNPCPVVTLAQPWGTWPNTITIDYGTDGCTRPDGRILKGKLIVYQTNEIRTAGAVRSITHDNFFVDDIKVEGARSWTNNGVNTDGFFSYTKTATDMKLTYPDGLSTTWNKTRTSTLIQGGGTPYIADDVWSTTGTASGVNRNGVAFSATILEALIKKIGCRWITDGVIQFTRDGNSSTLDFGNGECDRLGTVTNSNGDTFTVRLRR